MTARVLVVDDEEEMCRMLEAGLRRLGYEPSWTTSADEAYARVVAGEADVVVTDLRMRGLGGLELTDRIVGSRPDVPVVVMTAFGSLDTAVATIRAGAVDFLTKPLDADAVALSVERAMSQKKLRDEVKRLRHAVDEKHRYAELVGASPPMLAVYEMLERVAESDATILVTGESGTGKELVARALHRRSKRLDGPFMAINCAALPEALLESELFGHARGAFTDAKEKRAGLFVQADGGTLFLDEIGEMPITMQTKLLRALETRTVRAIGAASEVPFDVRIVAATNRDLDTAVEEQRFRADLLYRLDVIQIELPPLRMRGSDLLLLAGHFLEKHLGKSDKNIVGIAPAVAEKLLAYAWPGNVRELQNCIERAVVLAQHDEIMIEDLPEKIRSYQRSHVLVASDDPSELASMEEVERRYVDRVLESVGGNKNAAARILGWDRKTLYRRLAQWGKGG